MDRIKTVYFAGKVSKGGGYRGKLFGNSMIMSYGKVIYTLHNGGQVCYGGPYALACDHGCWHQAKHAMVADGHVVCDGWMDSTDLGDHLHDVTRGLMAPSVVERCLIQIGQADAVHVFLDSLDCYGTLVELGYAQALGKPIHIVVDPLLVESGSYHELWFCMNLQQVASYTHGGPDTICDELVYHGASYKERYHAYLRSSAWDEKRQAKIREAGGRCQLCNSKESLSVHHRTYERVFHEQLEDLFAICDGCHKKFHEINVLHTLME